MKIEPLLTVLNKGIIVNNMKIIAISKTLVDVFWGRMGWKIHTRVRHSPQGGLFQVSGNKLPANLCAEVSKALGW